MEIVDVHDRPAVLILDSKRMALDRVARPSLAAVAGPDVDVAGPVELDPARDETLEHRLVDVDRVGIDGVLVAGVNLREGANLSKTDENDGHIGKTRAGWRLGRKEAVLGDGNE